MYFPILDPHSYSNTVVCSNEYITITDEQIDKKRTEIQNAFHLSVHLNEEQTKTEQSSQQETNPLIYKFSEAKPLPLSLTSYGVFVCSDKIVIKQNERQMYFWMYLIKSRVVLFHF